jgi:hypothetical protein
MGAPGTLQQNPAMRQLARFRHSFASIAVSGGDSLYLVGKVLGHRQSRTTERYAHLKDDPLRAVANRTSERIAAIMQGQQGHQKSFHCRRQKRPVKVTKPEDARARAYV